MNDAAVTDVLRQASIKTENHLMAFSDSSSQYCPGTGISIGSYIMFNQGGPIDHGKFFQDQFVNQVQKVSTKQHVLQDWLWNISGC